MIPGFHPVIGMEAVYVTTYVLLMLSVQVIKRNVLLITNKWCLIQQGDKTVAAMSGLSQQPVRKHRTEELQLRKKAVLSESKVKHIQIQGLEVVPECTGGVQEKDLASDDEKKSAFGTEDSGKIWETNVEGDVNRCRHDSTDGSDEEISFVKL
jgi:hypothetical protein